MKVRDYKGHQMSNSLNAFNFYKKKTGRSLEGDMSQVAKIKGFQQKIMEDRFDDLTPEELKVFGEIDAVTTLSNIYCALRQAGDMEMRKLSFEEIIDRDQITIDDIQSEEFMEALMYLMGSNEKSKKLVAK